MSTRKLTFTNITVRLFLLFFIFYATGIQVAQAYYPDIYAYKGEHEYRIVGPQDACPKNVYLTLTPKLSRTKDANLKVEVRKCSGNFVYSGTYEILVDGVKRWSGTYYSGVPSFSVNIKPLADKQLFQAHNYQVKLISSNPNSGPIYTGTVRAAVWGRCWCTNYVQQRFNLPLSGMPDGGKFGPYLINNGFRVLSVNETPLPGDVVVFPNNNHVAVFISKTTTSLTVEQGGSLTDGWRDGFYCYNVRTQVWSTSYKVVYYTKRPSP